MLIGISYREISFINCTKIVGIQWVLDRLLPGRRLNLNIFLIEYNIRQFWLGRKVPVPIIISQLILCASSKKISTHGTRKYGTRRVYLSFVGPGGKAATASLTLEKSVCLKLRYQYFSLIVRPSSKIYLIERNIRTMPGQEQNTRVSAVPRLIAVTNNIVPGLVRTTVDSSNLIPRELVGLGKGLHTLQTENVYIEHIWIEDKLADLCAEWDSTPNDSILDSSDVDVVCHVYVLWGL